MADRVGRLLVLVALLSGVAGCVPDGPPPGREAGSRKASPPAWQLREAAALPAPAAQLLPAPPADAGAPPRPPCPPPARRFENAYEPLEAARAVQVRLTGMARAHCLRSLDTPEGIEALEAIGPLYDLQVFRNRKLSDALAVGTFGWVGLYRMERNRARPRARLLALATRSGLPCLGPNALNGLYPMKVAVFQVPDTNLATGGKS